METIDVFEFPHRRSLKKIELLLGDLTQIPLEHAVDVLVVSAFPGEYLPTQTSLIGALSRRGVSVAKLAEEPEVDLTENFSCWLSRPIGIQDKSLNFKRILCFEAARHFHERLEKAGLSVFIDRLKIKTGAAWQQTIYEALDACNMVAVLYSPYFLQSKMCKEEFNIAKMRAREADREILFPLLIDDARLPTYMKMLQYIDCRISDKPRIEAAAAQLADSLRN